MNALLSVSDKTGIVEFAQALHALGIKLLSTHNPAMLDALPDKAVPDVVFCYRDTRSGDSRLVRLGSLPDAPELFIQDSLGHLMTSGALDRFVKTHPGPEARKQQARAWLAALRTSAPGVVE